MIDYSQPSNFLLKNSNVKQGLGWLQAIVSQFAQKKNWKAVTSLSEQTFSWSLSIGLLELFKERLMSLTMWNHKDWSWKCDNRKYWPVNRPNAKDKNVSDKPTVSLCSSNPIATTLADCVLIFHPCLLMVCCRFATLKGSIIDACCINGSIWKNSYFRSTFRKEKCPTSHVSYHRIQIVEWKHFPVVLHCFYQRL